MIQTVTSSYKGFQVKRRVTLIYDRALDEKVMQGYNKLNEVMVRLPEKTQETTLCVCVNDFKSNEIRFNYCV